MATTSSQARSSRHSRPPGAASGGVWRLRTVPLTFLLLLTAAIYWPSLDHEFQYDDKWKLLHNPAFKEPLTFFQAFGSNEYKEEVTRLLPNLSFAANRMIWGWQPFPFHLTNLLLHLFNVVLVALLGRHVLTRLGVSKRSPVPLLGATLFALHPLNCEAVVYCNARPNLMAVSFYLLTLMGFVRAMESAELPAFRRLKRWGLFAAGLLCTLLCKELAVTVVVTAPLLYFWVTEGREGDYRQVHRRMWLSLAALVLVGTAAVLLTGASREVFSYVLESGNRLTGSWVLTLALTVLGQAQVLVHYLLLALLPLPRFLNIDHNVPHLHERLFGAAGTAGESDLLVLAGPLLSALFLVLAFVAVTSLRHRSRFLSFFLVWFFLCHAPTSLVPRGEALVEYRTYLPMVGICLALAWLLDRGATALRQQWRYARRKNVRRAMALCLVAALATGTALRSRVWATELSMWQDAVDKIPDNPRAYNNLGVAYLLRNEPDRAEILYRQALALRPDYADAQNNLGNLLAQRGELDRATEHLRLAIAYDPELAGAHNNLGNVLSAQQRPEEAIAHYRQALELNPYLPDAESNLGLILMRQGKLEEATAHYRAALELLPESAEALNNLGYVLAKSGELEEAMHRFEQALQIREHYAEAHNNLGNVLSLTGRLDEAIAHYRTALEIRPDFASAHDNLGSALRNRGELDEAIVHFKRALEIKPDYTKVRKKLQQVTALRDRMRNDPGADPRTPEP